jgi:hypothetical protein
MEENHPSRVQAFRASMIKELPSAPNNREARASLQAMPTRQLILAFITWRMRLIPAKPRKVKIWGSVLPSELKAVAPKLRSFLQKVEAGRDLTSHLSDLVKTKGIVLPGANPGDRGKDIDQVLTRHGLHHFHIGLVDPDNPKGRSGVLVFAEVLETEFRIIAISNHGAFKRGSSEQVKFFGICNAYIARDIPAGQAFMLNPVTTSGHAVVTIGFSVKCEDQIAILDPQLDDPAFIDKLYNDQPILRDGKPVVRPPKPLLTWFFDDLKFGILDRRTEVFFCIYPFFSR